MTQKHLAPVRFPLGELNEEEVRGIAKARKFRNAGKPDSQDI